MSSQVGNDKIRQTMMQNEIEALRTVLCLMLQEFGSFEVSDRDMLCGRDDLVLDTYRTEHGSLRLSVRQPIDVNLPRREPPKEPTVKKARKRSAAAKEVLGEWTAPTTRTNASAEFFIGFGGKTHYRPAGQKKTKRPIHVRSTVRANPEGHYFDTDDPVTSWTWWMGGSEQGCKCLECWHYGKWESENHA